MPRLLPLLLLPTACAAQQRLQEDLTAAQAVPLGSEFDLKLPSDPDQTGIAIQPRVQHVIGPSRLLIVNRGEDAVCQVYEDTACPSLGAVIDELDPIERGERWEVEGVECAILDVVCLPADFTDRTPAIRVFSWFVEPPVDDDA